MTRMRLTALGVTSKPPEAADCAATVSGEEVDPIVTISAIVFYFVEQGSRAVYLIRLERLPILLLADQRPCLLLLSLLPPPADTLQGKCCDTPSQGKFE